MSIFEEIISKRSISLVHCGFSGQAKPTLSELAMEFGLAADPSKYHEIDITSAKRLLEVVLSEDMAYNAEIMPADDAAELVSRFLDHFGEEGVHYYTNGEFLGPRDLNVSWRRVVWNPMTEATFDTGVMVIGHHGSGCLWIEDED